MGYTFWIETYTGERIEWPRLTKAQALAMYRTTHKGSPDNVKRYGWVDHTEGYAEPVSERVRRATINIYATSEGKDAKTFDEWLNT